MKIEIDVLDPPEGWVFDGYRVVRLGELFFYNGKWGTLVSHECSSDKYPVAVKAKPKWRPAILDHLAPGNWLSIDCNGTVNVTSEKPEFIDVSGGYWDCDAGTAFIVLSEPIQLRGPEACWPTGPVES